MDVRKLEKRLRFFRGAVFAVFIILAIGLSNLQIVNGGEYDRLAQENRIRLIPITAPRGVFKDKYGRELVNSRPSFTVSYMNVRSKESEQDEVFRILGAILDIPEYTQVTDQQYTIGEKSEIYLQYLPVTDANGDGKIDVDDIKIIEKNSGEKISPHAFNPDTGKIQLALEPGADLLISYQYHTLKNKISHQGYKQYMPVRLKKDVDFQTVAEIEEKRLPGVVIETEPIRNYLYGSAASHIFGYVGEINQEELANLKGKGYRPGDLIGKMGLEKVLESHLKGKDGGQQVEVTASGRPIKVLGQEDPISGHTVNLTTDIKLQQVAENALREQLLRLQTDKYKPYPNAKKGAVVVLDIKTGGVLAMVSIPDYDPNIFARGITQKEWDEIATDPLKPMVNIAISGTYPPGSVFKMITATAALEKKVTNETEYIRDTGVYWTILPKKCWLPGGHGMVNFEKAIAQSCNIYFYEMGRRMGIDAIEEYSKKFGLGKLTGIELPGEKAGIVASREYKKKAFKNAQDKIWYPAETLDAAIGQGYNSFTPIQIANYVAAIANEGFWMKPHLIKSILDADGKEVMVKTPEIGGQIDVSRKTFELVKKGMRGAVTSGGTAYSVFPNFPIQVAGKTGTAEWDVKKDNHGWFVAFAPFEDPEIAVAVFIEQAGSGGTTGGPIAKAIIEHYFNLNQVNEGEDYLIQP